MMNSFSILFWKALELLSLILAIVAMVNHKMDWAIYNAVMAVYFKMCVRECDD